MGLCLRGKFLKPLPKRFKSPQEKEKIPPTHYCTVVLVIGWLTAKAAEDCTHSRTLSRGPA